MTLQNETGKFILSFYGNSLALGFKGDSEFINRCFNWAHNYGITNGSLHWFYDRGGNFAYIIVKSREAVIKGLTQHFRAEIIMGREIKPLKDELHKTTQEPIIEYNEKAIEKLARQRAETFFKERIELENFLSRIPMSIAPVYDTPGFGRKTVNMQNSA